MDVQLPDGATDTLREIRHRVYRGLAQEEILSYVFDSLNAFIPFDRVGLALREGEVLRSAWVKSRLPVRFLKVGYTAPVAGSSLGEILKTGTPRLISDLEEYQRAHPHSKSTMLILKDGIRSSITFPLELRGDRFGVLFFSSRKANVFSEAHIRLLNTVSENLSLVVEHTLFQKARQDLADGDVMLKKVLHDIRSPISVIIGFTDLLLSSKELNGADVKTKEIFHILKRNSEMVLRLLEGLWDFVEFRKSNFSIQIDKIGIDEFLQETRTCLKPICEAKRIHLNLTTQPPLPEIWWMDAGRIRQVLENLVSNAVKFSRPETTVTIKVWLANAKLNFSVIDQGPGIPQNELPKLFKEFSVTSVRPTAGEKSTGLGLAICKQIVTAHGGEIGVESHVGVGSEFQFSLPEIAAL